MLRSSEDELQEAYAAFKGKEPEPLNRQFPDRLSKQEAVAQKLKRKVVTELYPSGQQT